MGSQQSRKGQDRQPRSEGRARVVNMRAWKARKKIRTMRGRSSWGRYVLLQLSYLLVILAVGTAILSCIPSSLQFESIIWAWFFSSVGAAAALILQVLLERKWSTRFLFIYLACMAVSLVAGLVWA